MKPSKLRNKVTQAMVAERTGVSLATVSAVLSPRNKSFFSAETIDKIMKAAYELGYIQHGKARKYARNTVKLPVELTIRRQNSSHVLSTGTAILRDVSEEGFLLRDIRSNGNMDKGYLPLEPFIMEVQIPDVGLSDFKLEGSLIRVRTLKNGIEMGFKRSDTKSRRRQLLKQLV